MNNKTIFAGAALAGLLSGAVSAQASMNQTPAADHAGTALQMADAAKGTHSCKGKNACKGQGGCKSSDNGCKGKNSCKGKGGCSSSH